MLHREWSDEVITELDALIFDFLESNLKLRTWIFVGWHEDYVDGEFYRCALYREEALN